MTLVAVKGLLTCVWSLVQLYTSQYVESSTILKMNRGLSSTFMSDNLPLHPSSLSDQRSDSTLTTATTTTTTTTGCSVSRNPVPVVSNLSTEETWTSDRPRSYHIWQTMSLLSQLAEVPLRSYFKNSQLSSGIIINSVGLMTNNGFGILVPSIAAKKISTAFALGSNLTW
jgi:hypothetical protein